VTLLVLTDRRQARRPLVETIRAAVDGGARLVVLREKDLPRARRLALAELMRAILEPVGGRLIVAGTDPLGGPAVHLSATDPPPRAGTRYVGRSCHDAGELARASTVDYVTLSPVFATASKPGYGPPLGTAQFARLVAGTPVPVFALGGIADAALAAKCRAAGAAGVAVMGAVMRAADPAAAVQELL
jgi:thiamine-phosphate diphosphorylase